jgi:peptide chain release factor 1
MADLLLGTGAAFVRKLEELRLRHESLQAQLNDPSVLSSGAKLVAISKEAGQLQGVVGKYADYRKAREAAEGLKEMAGNKADAEMAEMANAELPEVEARADELLESLKDELVAAEDNAIDSFFLEVRAGTGGEEAALFCRDLFEMYRFYAGTKGWSFIVSDFSVSERGGFKEVIVNCKGNGAYRHLRFEGGGHRVQRVPETEAQGRIHTLRLSRYCLNFPMSRSIST